jgi:competence protein ComEA
MNQGLLASLTGLALVGGLALAAPKKPAMAPTAATSSTMATAKVNLNKASVAQLEKLPGVGPKLAAEIVKNRPYKNGADLEKKVKGIGPKLWTAIRGHVSF